MVSNLGVLILSGPFNQISKLNPRNSGDAIDVELVDFESRAGKIKLKLLKLRELLKCLAWSSLPRNASIS